MNGVSIKPYQSPVFRVPGIPYNQDHTTVKLTFKDGSVLYIDCGTIAGGNIDDLNGPSNIGLPSQIPGHWEDYANPKPSIPSNPVPIYNLPRGVVPIGR